MNMLYTSKECIFHVEFDFISKKYDLIDEKGKISFLDVLIMRKENGTFKTKVYRKKTANNIYINWTAFAPKTWKIGTLKSTFRRAFMICSEEEDLSEEIKFIEDIFNRINGYPKRVIKKALFQIKKSLTNESNVQNNAQNIQEEPNAVDKVIVHPHMNLPFLGPQGNTIIDKLKNKLKR